MNKVEITNKTVNRILLVMFIISFTMTPYLYFSSKAVVRMNAPPKDPKMKFYKTIDMLLKTKRPFFPSSRLIKNNGLWKNMTVKDKIFFVRPYGNNHICVFESFNDRIQYYEKNTYLKYIKNSIPKFSFFSPDLYEITSSIYEALLNPNPTKETFVFNSVMITPSDDGFIVHNFNTYRGIYLNYDEIVDIIFMN